MREFLNIVLKDGPGAIIGALAVGLVAVFNSAPPACSYFGIAAEGVTYVCGGGIHQGVFSGPSFVTVPWPAVGIIVGGFIGAFLWDFARRKLFHS